MQAPEYRSLGPVAKRLQCLVLVSLHEQLAFTHQFRGRGLLPLPTTATTTPASAFAAASAGAPTASARGAGPPARPTATLPPWNAAARAMAPQEPHLGRAVAALDNGGIS